MTARNRTEELLDVLGAPTALDDREDRSFEQQMKDLSVEVEKPEWEWYKPNFARRNIGLGDKISINSGGLTIGRDAINKITAIGPAMSIGVVKTKGKNMLALRPGKTGFTVTVTHKRSHRLGTKKLVKWLAERGITKGVYSLKEIKGGFLAIPEGKQL